MSYSTDNNIEDRIKSIIFNKLHNSNFEETLDDNKIEIIDKIFQMFPDLKDQKNYSEKKNYSENEKKKSHNPVINITTEVEEVLTEFKLENKIYYKDKIGGIWNENAELVGTIKKPKKNSSIINNDYDNLPEYIFFDNKIDIAIDINKILNK